MRLDTSGVSSSFPQRQSDVVLIASIVHRPFPLCWILLLRVLHALSPIDLSQSRGMETFATVSTEHHVQLYGNRIPCLTHVDEFDNRHRFFIIEVELGRSYRNCKYFGYRCICTAILSTPRPKHEENESKQPNTLSYLDSNFVHNFLF